MATDRAGELSGRGGIAAAQAASEERLTIRIKPAPPFRLDLTVRVLQRHPANLIDRFDGMAYRRVLIIQDRPVSVTVIQTAPPERPMLEVTVKGAHLPPITRCRTMSALQRLLGLTCCLDDFDRVAADDAMLRSLAGAHVGLKPPRSLTLFEGLVNAIACQQVTAGLGVRLVNQLAATSAQRPPAGQSTVHAFPDPGDVADLTADDLRSIGFSRSKAESIVCVARSLTDGRLDPDGFEDRDNAAAAARLGALRGVGPWTIDEVLLRGLGRLEVLPASDASNRRQLQQWLRLLTPLDRSGVEHALARLRGSDPLSSHAGAPERKRRRRKHRVGRTTPDGDRHTTRSPLRAPRTSSTARAATTCRSS
ncbi:MAG: DNA-3-methyladenine glycosylase 2 family protein [Alphaproteobacteria bacterium]